MPILASETLLCENKKTQWKMLPSVEIRTQASHNLWFQVQHYPFWAKLAFACKTETSGSLYSHALLNIAKSSQFLQVQKSSDSWTEV